MSKVSTKGIIVGNIADITFSSLTALLLATYRVHKPLQTHNPLHLQAAREIGSVPLPTVELLIGLACSVFAGYIAAHIAKHHEMLNGALSSILCTVLGLALLFSVKNHHTHIGEILLFAGPLCGMLGGYLKSLSR